MWNLRSHDTSCLNDDGILNGNRIRNLGDRIDSILYIRLLQTLIGISESTIDFLLDRPGLIDQLHQLPDQDIPFLVHQFIPLLRKRKRIFRKHQVSFCRKCSWIQSSHLFYSSLLATDPGVALVVTPSSRFV